MNYIQIDKLRLTYFYHFYDALCYTPYYCGSRYTSWIKTVVKVQFLTIGST